MLHSKFKGIHVVSRLIVNVTTFGSAIAITLFPFVFYLNKNVRANDITRNHESIHIRQQMECAVVGLVVSTILSLLFRVTMWMLIPGALLFYLVYIVDYIVKYFVYKDWNTAYREISFEREAYLNANIESYIGFRKPFSWIKYL